MKVGWTPFLPAITLALSGCVSAAPLVIGSDNPASPAATAGLVGTSTAIDDYKSVEDFAERTAGDASAQPPGQMWHDGMAGMGTMSGMPGMNGMEHDHMHHGGASPGGAPQ
jgi:hypothetical protein